MRDAMNKNNKKLNNKKTKFINRRAFTLVEVIVAMGIFVLIMAGSSGAFAMAFKSYRSAKNVNENLKNAQYAMNLMSKTFRTSTVRYSTASDLIVYDYSQGTTNPGYCMRYRFISNELRKSSANTTLAGCIVGASFSTALPMTTGVVTGAFDVVSSVGNAATHESTTVGKVTVMMNISNGTGSNLTSARIQSTSSLRDYTISNVGIDFTNNPAN